MSRRRLIRQNSRVVTALVALPDQFGRQAASLGLATASFSPMSAGTGSKRLGLAGYGTNRWEGRIYAPLQNWVGAVTPVNRPSANRLGIGAGVSGQPGLPSTGDTKGATSSIGWMTLSSVSSPGMGGAG